MIRKLAPIALVLSLSSSAAFSQWQHCAIEGKDYNCFATMGDVIFAGTANCQYPAISAGGVFASTDYGATWYAASNGIVDSEIVAMGTFDRYVFASTAGGRLYRSGDLGSKWTEIAGPSSAKPVASFAAIGSDLFAATDSEGVFVSSNNGDSWTAVNSGLTERNIHRLATMGEVLFANGSYDGEGGVYKTTDQGSSWSEVGKGAFDIAVLGPQIYAAMYHTVDDGVTVSTDEGKTWREGESGGCGVYDLLGSAGTVIFSDHTQYGVTHSTDFGATWVRDDSVMHFNAVIAVGSYLLVGTTQGMFRMKQGATTPPDQSTSGVKTGLDLNDRIVARLYPNPIARTVTISLDLSERRNVAIAILDGIGNEVARMYDGAIEKGTRTLYWDIPARLTNGQYFCCIQSAGALQTLPIVIAR